MERTFVIFKPDAVRRRLVGRILARFEDASLSIETLRGPLWAPRATIEEHYAEHRDKPYFAALCQHLQSGTLLIARIVGDNAITRVRALVGPYSPLTPGTIRGDMASTLMANLVHSSDSPDSADRECTLWFRDYAISPSPPKRVLTKCPAGCGAVERRSSWEKGENGDAWRITEWHCNHLVAYVGDSTFELRACSTKPTPTHHDECELKSDHVGVCSACCDCGDANLLPLTVPNANEPRTAPAKTTDYGAPSDVIFRLQEAEGDPAVSARLAELHDVYLKREGKYVE